MNWKFFKWSDDLAIQITMTTFDNFRHAGAGKEQRSDTLLENVGIKKSTTCTRCCVAYQVNKSIQFSILSIFVIGSFERIFLRVDVHKNLDTVKFVISSINSVSRWCFKYDSQVCKTGEEQLQEQTRQSKLCVDFGLFTSGLCWHTLMPT